MAVTYINADDEQQVDFLFETNAHIEREHITDPIEIAALMCAVNNFRGDNAAVERERRADQREIARHGQDGWNE